MAYTVKIVHVTQTSVLLMDSFPNGMSGQNVPKLVEMVYNIGHETAQIQPHYMEGKTVLVII